MNLRARMRHWEIIFNFNLGICDIRSGGEIPPDFHLFISDAYFCWRNAMLDFADSQIFP